MPDARRPGKTAGHPVRFDHARLVEERMTIHMAGTTWKVSAHSVTFTFTWAEDGEVTILRSGKTATATMTDEQLALFQNRIEQGHIAAALALFTEIQAELAAAPSPEISDEIVDGEPTAAAPPRHA